jgi:hypothetical protein
VREVEEPSVSVTRRRSVTTIEEPDTEVHRTVVKKKPAKKVAVKKAKKTNKVVMKKRGYQVVDEPVEVRRRTVRRYEEVNEPSVSVNRRTTIRRTQDTSPSVDRYRLDPQPHGCEQQLGRQYLGFGHQLHDHPSAAGRFFVG